MKLNVFNVELDGIDKCGKDSIRPYIFHLAPGKYLCRARGLLSQLAYAKLYKRDIDWDAMSYTKNTLFVLLDVKEEDWQIRCKITNEPDTGFTFEEMRKAFFETVDEMQMRFNIPNSQMIILNTSRVTPYEIAAIICNRLDRLNSYDNT